MKNKQGLLRSIKVQMTEGDQDNSVPEKPYRLKIHKPFMSNLVFWQNTHADGKDCSLPIALENFVWTWGKLREMKSYWKHVLAKILLFSGITDVCILIHFILQCDSIALRSLLFQVKIKIISWDIFWGTLRRKIPWHKWIGDEKHKKERESN